MTNTPYKRTRKKAVILATGGTIAGTGKAGKTAGYTPGTLTADELIAAVPGLDTVADIETVQVCNLNSDDMTGKIWLQLAKTINKLAADPDIDGFVITHGTDTLEETAYFLELTLKTDKPVVLTGSMRPASSLSADGPINLYQAVCTAVSDKTKGCGVLVVFADRIFSARFVTKKSTYHVSAVASCETGALGVVRDGAVYMYTRPAANNLPSFDISFLDTLPSVNIVYFMVDADPGILKYAAEHSDGIVIAGAGAGEFGLAYKSIIENIDIPVVVGSRVGEGIIIPENLLCKNTVAAADLPPQKAAVLLRLALTKTKDRETLQKMFLTAGMGCTV